MEITACTLARPSVDTMDDVMRALQYVSRAGMLSFTKTNACACHAPITVGQGLGNAGKPFSVLNASSPSARGKATQASPCLCRDVVGRKFDYNARQEVQARLQYSGIQRAFEVVPDF